MSLLEISHLTTKFETQQGTVSAVRDVSYHLEEGEVLGIVGESGSGKIVGMIFQDPMTFLNPILKIGIQMTEGIRKHQNCSKKEAEAKAIELMRQVGIPSPEKRLDQYPFEFSGGMRRRIIIATALACDPKLIIADEPTTALDVTVQAQILELLKKLTKEKGTSVIMITHDLGVVASMCDRIAIMYAGQIVEEGTVDEIFYEPHHPYTKGLLNSINNSAKDNDEPLVPIPGTPPDLLKLPKGCAFMSRCPYTMKICEVQASPVTTYSETHCCRCWLECMDETKITVSGEEAALEDSMAGSHFYPDFAAVLLKQKVAEQYGLKAENVLEVKNLCKYFDVNRGMKGAQKVIAVDGISFEVKKGETFGLVGESGCGKSVTSQSIMRLYDEKEEVSYSETVRFEGENLMEIPYKEMDKIRGNRIAMIFQDALSSLNPVYTVGNQVVEAICIHQNVEKKEAWQKAVEMLMKVGISEPEKRMRQYPHELFGGMRQRVMIAIALCCKPDLLIADEPTTALDVTVQAQIMDLIQQLKEEENMGVILITHDMAVVA